jgi:hypothetical protein
LRRVDDAVRVGRLDRVALEAALVDRVQEVLLVAEFVDGVGRQLDGLVELVKRLEKLLPAEALAHQRINHFLHFGGDHVAPCEFIVVEDTAEQPFGEQVLDEHLIDGIFTDVRVQGGLAEFKELGKGLLELLVVRVRLFDLGV